MHAEGVDNSYSGQAGVIISDLSGSLLEVNSVCEVLFGANPDELSGRNLTELFEDPFRSLIVSKLSFSPTRDAPPPPGVFFSGYACTFTGFRLHVIGIQKEEHLEFYLSGILQEQIPEQRFRALNEKLRDLSAHIESGMEQERKRMAREIHDGLGSSLSAIKMEMSVLKKILFPDAPPPKEAATVFGSMEKMIDGSIGLVRKLVTELRPEVLDELGLVSTIQWFAGDFKVRTGIGTSVTIFPKDFKLNPGISTAVYRIFQEIMNNIAKHARATRVTVFIRKHNDRLEMRVRDNGIGIHEDKVKHRRSFGIIGMQERVKLLNGKLNITGTRGEGTAIHLEIPIN